MKNYLADHHNLSTKRVFNKFAFFCSWKLAHNFFCHSHLFQCEGYWEKMNPSQRHCPTFLVQLIFWGLFWSPHSVNMFFPVSSALCYNWLFSTHSGLYYASFTLCPRHPVMGQREKHHWIQSMIFYYRITFWVFRSPVIFIHYICHEIILVLLVFHWICFSINRMGQWGRCTFMTSECISY